MKKLLYISEQGWLDTDVTILKHLACFYNVIFVVIFNKDGNQKFSQMEIKEYCKNNNIIFYPYVRRYRRREPLLIPFVLKILSAIKKEHPDIIYFSMFLDIYFNTLSIFVLPSSKTIVGIHDFKTRKGGKLLLLLDFAREIIYRSFKNFHFYEKNQAFLFLKTFPNKKYFTTQMPLKNYGFPPQKCLFKGAGITYFLFFGFIRHYKGLDLLIAAANMLRHNQHKFKIIISGNVSNLKVWKNYLGLIEDESFFSLNIRFITNEEIPFFFQKAHFLILPYRQVTQSGPFLTAINYNVPVIASDLPAFENYIKNGFNGFLFKNENVKDLAEKMEKAIKMSNSNYIEMSQNMKMIAENEFSTDKTITTMIEFFNRLL